MWPILPKISNFEPDGAETRISRVNDINTLAAEVISPGPSSAMVLTRVRVIGPCPPCGRVSTPCTSNISVLRYVLRWLKNNQHKRSTTKPIKPKYHSLIWFLCVWFTRLLISGKSGHPFIILSTKTGPLTHWGRCKMAAFSQTTLSNKFSWMKILEFRLKIHWSLFLRVLLTIFQHWFW